MNQPPLNQFLERVGFYRLLDNVDAWFGIDIADKGYVDSSIVADYNLSVSVAEGKHVMFLGGIVGLAVVIWLVVLLWDKIKK